MDEINIIAFTSGGLNIAVDASQVQGMINFEQAQKRGLDISSISDIFPLIKTSPADGTPKVLVIKDDSASGIIIESLDDISSVSIDNIRPMPSLIAVAEGSKAFWGILLKEDRIVLLIDLYKLPQSGKKIRR